MKKVVTIGGGGGHSAVLSALSEIPGIKITALCNTVDDGASTGFLMQEYGVDSYGDARKVISALADQDLLEYRFSKGILKEHPIGNLLLAGLQCAGKSYEQAIVETAEMFNLKHKVAPLTCKSPVLYAQTASGKIIKGQRAIVVHILANPKDPYRKVWIKPVNITLSKTARRALTMADTIIIPMGDLYSSIAPAFCSQQLQKLWPKPRAKIIWLPNFVAPQGHAHYKTASGALKFIQSLCPAFNPDIVVAHDGSAPNKLKNILQRQGYQISKMDLRSNKKIRVIQRNLIDHIYSVQRAAIDPIKRSPIKYRQKKLTALLKELIW